MFQSSLRPAMLDDGAVFVAQHALEIGAAEGREIDDAILRDDEIEVSSAGRSKRGASGCNSSR